MNRLIVLLCFIMFHPFINAQVQGGNGNLGFGNPGNGNGTIPPGGNNVIVYSKMKYTGMSKVLNNGVFGPNELGFLGGNTSSIYIPPGKSLRIQDSRGAVRTFTTSVSNLAQYGWDNRITSGYIETPRGNGGGFHGGNGNVPLPPPPSIRAIAYLFTDANFRGATIPIGRGRIGNLGITGNRRISSIQLTQGYAIKVYSGLNQTGHFRIFMQTTSNLLPFGWNNIIRSVEVIRY